MMRVLITKELRGLRSMAICIAGVYLLGLLYLFATEMPDEQRFDAAEWLSEYRPGTAAVLAIFGLMIGAGLLIQESEQGTLRFLDGLPLSRTRLFVAKAVAAFALMAFVPLIDIPSTLLFDWVSRSSIDPPFPWRFGAIIVALQLVAGGFLLALGMALSFVRHWFALMIGLLYWAMLWLRQAGIEQAALFDPYELLGVGLDAGRVLVPWGHVLAHLAGTVVCLAVAWLGFRNLGDRAQFAAQQMGKWRVLRFAGAGLRLAAPLVILAAVVKFIGPIEDADGKLAATPLGEDAFGRHETERFEFLFRAAQREQTQPLFDTADEVHDAVVEFFAAPPLASRIVVDLASPVVPHAAGQTNWTKIRMPLLPDESLQELRQILAHETAHVYIEQLGAGRLEKHFAAIRFLHEGLATHVEQREFATDEERAQNRRSVAAAWARGRVSFELLCDNEKLIRERDPNLVYPLGEVFARALVETHGPEAPARLLRAFGRRHAPVGLTGTALWRDTTQVAGLDLDRVVGVYEGTCAALANEEKAFVERLPRLSATVTIEGGEIAVRPKFAGTAPGEMICLVEIEGPLATETPALHRRDDGAFTLARTRLNKPVIRYLLGWRTPETPHPVFEPWAQAPL